MLGRTDGWSDFSHLERLILVEGKWNTLDIRLQDGQYTPDGRTDLLLHFDRLPFQDSTQRYRVEQESPLLSKTAARLGRGAAAFTAGSGGGLIAQGGSDVTVDARSPGDRTPGGRTLLTLVPGNKTLFAEGWGDFSLEFWLYPADLASGQTILRWAGSLIEDGKKVPQYLICRLDGRYMEWQFLRFFPGGDITLRGISPFLPRKWHHLLLRFDASTGLLEYLMDGVPEALTYATDTGSEGGTVLIPRTSMDGKLLIGEGLTGLIDELRLSRDCQDAPFLGRYPNAPGVGTTRLIDLGYTNSRLRRIEAAYSTPSNTDIYFSYRMSDRLEHALSVDSPWIPFVPNRDLTQPATGRFLQLRVELMSDGSGELSPSLSSMTVVYEPDLPPPPPSYVSVIAGDGSVELAWRRVNAPDAGGYMIYYGFAPGKYTGTAAAEGSSPLDVGTSRRFTLTGLENGRLYYFAVVSYDSSDPPHQSRFSMEVSARPSKVSR